MSDDHTYLYIPQGVLRHWGAFEATVMPMGVDVTVDLAQHYAPAVGYVPVYDSLEALMAEHGDVPYVVARQRREPPR